MKKSKKVTATDMGIFFSLLGITASILIIIMSFVDDGNKTVGIVLLCVCSAILSASVKNRKSGK